ncbi:MAG: Gfo/Idh/MocA family protein [Anaerorhabdus sp.]
MKKTLEIVVVGGGFIGKQHIEAIRRIPNTHIVAIVEKDIESAKNIAELYNIKNYFDNTDDLYNKLSFDVIHICTPNFLHYSMIKEAILNDVNVFCEKPLCISTFESDELVKIASTSKKIQAVNLNYRSNLMVREMRERIRQNKIGDILFVQAKYLQDLFMFDTDYDWHFDPNKVGASRAISDIGTHTFDLIQFVCDQKITSVFADLSTVYPTRKKREAIGETFSQKYLDYGEDVKVENEDAAIIIAKLQNGVKVSIVISQITGGSKNNFEICVSGSKSSIKWKQEYCDRLYIGRKDGPNEEIFADVSNVSKSVSRFASLPNGHAVGWADAFKNSINEFYRLINNEEANCVELADGHYLMKIVEACIKSNKDRMWIDIE